MLHSIKESTSVHCIIEKKKKKNRQTHNSESIRVQREKISRVEVDADRERTIKERFIYAPQFRTRRQALAINAWPFKWSPRWREEDPGERGSEIR